jgi:hypothetical protein
VEVTEEELVPVLEALGVADGEGMAHREDWLATKWSVGHVASSSSSSDQEPAFVLLDAGRHFVLPGVSSTGPFTMRPLPPQM